MPVRKPAAAAPPLPEPAPKHELPALVIITKYLCARPPSLASEPFEVPFDLFEAGAAEMGKLMKARGFPLPTSADCPFVNFLLFGKIIIQGDKVTDG